MELFDVLDAGVHGKDGKRLDPAKTEVLRFLLDSLVNNQPYELSFRRLRSKKNIVFKIGISTAESKPFDIIAKLFVTPGFERELEVLKRSQKNGLAVPSLIDAKNGVLLMEFIEGTILTDIVNETFSTTVIENLANWYYGFHDIHSLIKGDPRLRNFVYRDKILYGFDFEESRPGDWMEDIGGVAASLLDTRPIFHEAKQKLAWHLFYCYLDLAGLQRNENIEGLFQKTVAKTLKQTWRWRDDPTLLALANRIESNGIPRN